MYQPDFSRLHQAAQQHARDLQYEAEHQRSYPDDLPPPPGRRPRIAPGLLVILLLIIIGLVGYFVFVR